MMVVFLLVLAGLYGLVVLGGDWAPRLGLDLQGGTRITLEASTLSGSEEVTEESMNEAVGIIRQRVNGTGVAEAEVTTQASNQIVVEIPGEQRGGIAETIGRTAQLRFRLVVGQPVPAPPQQAQQPGGQQGGQQGEGPGQGGQQDGQQNGGAGQDGSPGNDGRSDRSQDGGDAEGPNNRPAPAWGAQQPDPTEAPGQPEETRNPGTPEETETPRPEQQNQADLEGAELLDWRPGAQLQQEFNAYTCPPPGQRQPDLVDNPDKPLITCDDAFQKYLLTPAIIEGTELNDASAQLPTQGVQYVVNLSFDSEGSDVFGDVTAGINQTGRQFAIVLDGEVLSAPTVDQGPIRTGEAIIEGNFTQRTATNLANALRYGALPLSFEHLATDEEGPQLADDHLRAGIIAGIVGLILILVYCLVYYRALGFVVVTSLGIAGAGTYAVVMLLSETLDFTLTLPGIAGLIVAIGITADSFIVFFERLRDEVRDGRSLRAAVEHGWTRARTTILAADAVTFLAALILYIFAIGVVKGFAFALGLTTLIDVFVVFFFTYPLVSLLARRRFFSGGNRLSGLDPKHLGVKRLVGAGMRGSRTTGEVV
ncbi:MAG: protein translocase subunit SecD [Propionibacteriales bacterium]|nr:protein translocase subunit SecD [Propionibacteriales bacterium]